MRRIASKLDAQLKDLIRKARESAGLSQRGLADLVDVTGSTVQKYEDGSLKVSLDTLRAISEATGFEFRWFLEQSGYLPCEDVEEAKGTEDGVRTFPDARGALAVVAAAVEDTDLLRTDIAELASAFRSHVPPSKLSPEIQALLDKYPDDPARERVLLAEASREIKPGSTEVREVPPVRIRKKKK